MAMVDPRFQPGSPYWSAPALPSRFLPIDMTRGADGLAGIPTQIPGAAGGGLLAMPAGPQPAPQAPVAAAMPTGPAMMANAAPAAPQAAQPRYMMGGPFGDFLRNNNTALQTLAAGLLSGSRRGLSGAIGSLPQAQAMDRQAAAMGQLTEGLDPKMAALARAFPQLYAQQAFAAPAERRIIKDADGRQRYADTGEYVFSGVQKDSGEGVPFLAADPRAQTPGQEAIDKEFGKDFVTWSSTGRADTQKQLEQLSEVRDRLRAVVEGTSSEDLTGYWWSSLGIPGVPGSGDPLRAKLNPPAAEVKAAVEEVVQRNLRSVLGAQFTEREGERLIARAYDVNLSEPENLKRVERLIASIAAAAKAKDAAAEYFQRNGTLYGWNGQLPTMSSIEDAAGLGGGSDATVGAPADYRDFF